MRGPTPFSTFAYNTEGERVTTTEQMPGGQSRVTTMEHATVNDANFGVSHQEATTVNGVITNVSLRKWGRSSHFDIAPNQAG